MTQTVRQRREDAHTAFLYNRDNGKFIRDIKGSYRWACKYRLIIEHVSISELPDHGAYVDVDVGGNVTLREKWGSFKLAYQRYHRWSKVWGFTLSHHMYHVITPGAW